MKKHISILVFTIVLFPTLIAQTHDEMFHSANVAYDSGQYCDAAATYSSIVESGYEDWKLYYNLGNAYYRMDEIGKCILYYERALRLAPNKQIIKDNLDLARSKTTDNIEELPRTFLYNWMQAIVNITTPKGWRNIVLILIIALCVTAIFFFTARNYNLRKTMFITGGVLIVLIFFSSFNAAISTRNRTIHDEAIVTSPLIVVKGSPDVKSVDKFILHEGTKLKISDRQDEWWQIEIADGKNGWINSGAEII